MIITRIQGGLGNQMFQYAVAKAVAQKLEDTFKLDTGFFLKQTLRKYELNHFCIDEEIATEEEVRKLSGGDRLIVKVAQKFRINAFKPISYYQEKQIMAFDQAVFAYEKNLYLDGYWQNANYFEGIREEIISDFALKDEMSTEAQSVLTQIQGSESVSVHIRRGDYVDNVHTNNVHGVCGIEYYKNAVHLLNKKRPGLVFFIFSDDIDWCKNNLEFIENIVYVDNTQSAIEDLELMKHCSHNIIANSTFSWWGAWLNQNPRKIVVAPKYWFQADKWKDLTLASNDWVKV